MKSFVLLCLVAAAAAAPAATSGDAQILKNDFHNTGVENYQHAFETSDGTKAEANGELVPGNGKDVESYYVVKGFFEWIGADGVTYTSHYVADNNGYRPEYTQGPNGVIPVEVLKSFGKSK